MGAMEVKRGRLPVRVIYGGAGPAATRQVKLDKRTLTPRTARLSSCPEVKILTTFPEPTLSMA